ncbi:hypothetical protein M9Y10_005511 [Tritrichomonas musculus]|uniref:F5/8 type C domain-containing protein n=1 Tax=Tritrichomonas musculus TaxID=1915356 RepID=A0ABR2JCD8_9EUKA
MNEVNKIKLSTTSILNVPIQAYDDDFTFIVNNREYKTNRLTASLLSPEISRNQKNDPTTNEFIIKTEQDGDFQHILDLTNFEDITFQEKEIPFIEEIIEILNNESIEIQQGSEITEINMKNIIPRLINHEKNRHFYSKILQQEIKFISSHFFEISEEVSEEIQKLSRETLNQILTEPSLQLESEDQLISIINELYLKDNQYFTFYEYVDFSNVTSQKMTEFINIYNMNDLTQQIWINLSGRLQQRINSIKETKLKKIKNKTRYHSHKIFYNENNEFDGIINFLKTTSTKGIKDEINVFASSIFDNDFMFSPENAIIYDDQTRYFVSNDEENSWLCIDFKDHKIVPNYYSIRSINDSPNNAHPKSWVIEGSNDSINWTIIDQRNSFSYLNGNNLVHAFPIENENTFRYVRMRITDLNWFDSYNLTIDSIEFFGILI